MAAKFKPGDGVSLRKDYPFFPGWGGVIVRLSDRATKKHPENIYEVRTVYHDAPGTSRLMYWGENDLIMRD